MGKPISIWHGEITYANDVEEKKMVEVASNSFYSKYKAFEEERGEMHCNWTKDDWIEAYLKFDSVSFALLPPSLSVATNVLFDHQVIES